MSGTLGVMSMTGFGSATFEVAGSRYRVDVKTVNHRHLNIRFHMPPELSAAEAAATRLLKSRLLRGSVEVRVGQEAAAERPLTVHVDHKGADVLMEKLHELSREIGATPPTLDLVLKLGDFVRLEGQSLDQEAATEGLVDGLTRAVDAVEAMRLREGASLATDLRARLETMDRVLASVEEAAPKVVEGYEARLRSRLDAARQKHGVELDEGRVVSELTLFAERADVTEETVRARTHVRAFLALLDPGEPRRGKRMDFLAQELGREMNTVGAKCRDVGMAEAVVDGKVELERIREQVQNIV